VQALSARDGRAVLDAVDMLRSLGLSASGTLEAMATLLQQMAVVQAVPDALDAADPEHQDALRLAPALAADETQLLYSMVLQGRGELGLMGDEYAALTMVLLRFMAFPAAGSPAPAVVPRAPAAPVPAARVASTVSSPAVSPPARSPVAATAPVAAAAPGPVPVRTAPPPAVSPVVRAQAAEPDIPPWVSDGPPPEDDDGPRTAPLRAPAPPAMTMPAPRAPLATVIAAVPASAPETTPLGDRWALRVQPLGEQGRIGALVRELAWQAGVTDCVEGPDACTWTLVVERESLRTDSLRDKLAAALTAEEGKPHQLVLEAGVPGDSVARREAWERLRRQAEAEQLIRDDPAVKDLLTQFKTARIVPGTVKPL
jgi:DNA polymerase-3 subunit gamma/tau